MKRWLAIPLAAAVAGCAAIRIDVDVYKGPLANHEEVQLRQYAALAVAAKPVLANLRNRLQERANGGARLPLSTAQREEWVPDDGLFRHEGARLVNGAMSFYENKGDGRLANEIAAMNAIFKSLRRAYVLFPVRKPADIERAERLQRAYPVLPPLAPKDPKELVQYRKAALATMTARFLDGEPPQSVEREIGCKAARETRGGVQNTAGIGRRSAGEMQCACENLKLAINALGSEEERRTARGSARELSCALGSSSNEAFEVMSDRGAVEGYSLALLGKLDHDFIDRVVEISAVFVESRKDMRELWKASAQAVQKLEGSGDMGQREAAAVILAKTTQPRAVACYLTRPGHDATAGLGPLAAILGSGGSKLLSRDNDYWDDFARGSSSAYLDSSDAIRRAAIAHPEATVRLLREADTALTVAGNPARNPFRGCTALSQEDDDRATPPAARKYGAARGPTLDSTFESDLDGLNDSIQLIAAGTAAGFDRARLPDGIVRLTEAYLVALEKANVNRTNLTSQAAQANRMEVEAARRRLEESLVAWAERVLVAVNSRVLLPRENEYANDAPEQAREMAVLQAVANTLIVHADDFRRRESHRARQEERYRPEAWAVRNAFSLSAAQAYDDLLGNLRITLARLEAELDKLPKPAAGDTTDTDLTTLKGDLQKAEAQAKDVQVVATSLVSSPDKAALDALVKALASTKTPGDTLDEVVVWLKKEAKSDPLGPQARTPRQQARAATAEYLEKHKRALIEGLDKNKTAPMDVLDALRARAASVLAEWGKRIAELHVGIRQMEAKKKPLVARQNTQSRAETLAKVGALLTNLRGDVLARAEAAGAREGADMRVLLLDQIAAEKGKAQADKETLAAAGRLVKDTSPARFVPLLEARPGEVRAQRDVLDDMLALLRHRRTQALASGNTATAKSVEDAIAKLNEDRAELNYLRPASAYLRSVYSATSLQADPDVNWVNLLARNTNRAIGGEALSPFDREYLKTRTEIDKQFWQNINTVNLAGGGSTNYVLAKDDVGNWYVKTYSADPEAIFRSAQGLALYGFGKSMDLNLVRRAQLQREVNLAEPGSDRRRVLLGELKEEEGKGGSAGAAAMGRVYEQFSLTYRAETARQLEKLIGNLDKIGAALPQAWKQPMSGNSAVDVDAALQAKYAAADWIGRAETRNARQKLVDAREGTGMKEPGLTNERSNAILAALESVRLLRISLRAEIEGDDSLIGKQVKQESDARADAAKQDADAAAQTTAATAKADLDNARENRTRAARGVAAHLDSLVTLWADERLATIRQYETAVTVVGQAANSPASGSAR